ncbi:MAG TPA: hypothetical protein VI643_08165, partial [Planctomycetota bacterium]|nr:hypothetical protein [Planctomycetota bacterium]
MKRSLAFAWLALLAPLAALAQTAPEAMPVQLDSKHYHISATAAKDEAQELLDFMELVHHTYLQLLKPDDPAAVESKTFTLVLYKNNDEYVASGAPKGSGAFYNGKLLVGFYDDFMMRPYFAHEGMHQFTDITSKAFRNFPMWFSEGIAD